MTESEMRRVEELSPSEIEARSMAIIAQELAARGGRHFSPQEELVVKRVIHTTADFDFARHLIFSDGAVERALEALRGGACIVTDTNMARVGINRRSLAARGGEIYCFMADEDVANEAAGLGRDCIFAVGNAPTALLRLYELVKEGRLCQKLIIGVPVGFVNVEAAKERIASLTDTPYIVAVGRKGGSAVAAAVCNALLYQICRK